MECLSRLILYKQGGIPRSIAVLLPQFLARSDAHAPLLPQDLESPYRPDRHACGQGCGPQNDNEALPPPGNSQLRPSYLLWSRLVVMLPPWAQIVFVGYMSRDQIHQVIAREREMLAAIEKSRPQLQLSNSRFAEQRNEIIKELEAELAYRDQNGID